MWPFNRKKETTENEVSREKRSMFSAAAVSNITHSWGTSPVRGNQAILSDLRAIRARSREEYRNNRWVKRYVSLLKSNVIGPNGIGFQSRVKDQNGSLDRVANDAIEAAYSLWSRSAGISGLSRVEVENLKITTLAIDGEYFVRHIKGEGVSEFGYAQQLIDPELVPIHLHDDVGGRRVRMGIEYDDYSRPTAYYVSDQDGEYHYSSGRYTRIPAEEITHVFVPEFIDQKRGIPWTVSSLGDLHQLEGFSEAALVNARAGATKLGFIEEPGADGFTGDGVDANGVPFDDAEPGSWHSISQGATVHSYDPQYPSNEFGPFTQEHLRGAAAGFTFGVSYFRLANDLAGVNYTSGRLGELEDREIYKGIQNFIIEKDKLIEFENFISMSLLFGKVKTKSGKSLPFSKIDKFSNPSFSGKRWEWTDPLKASNANRNDIEQNLKSPQQVIRESGGDPEKVLDEISAWNSMTKSIVSNNDGKKDA